MRGLHPNHIVTSDASTFSRNKMFQRINTLLCGLLILLYSRYSIPMIRRMPYSGNCKLFRTLLTHSLRFPIEEKRREFIHLFRVPKKFVTFGEKQRHMSPYAAKRHSCEHVAECAINLGQGGQKNRSNDSRCTAEGGSWK